MTRARTQQTNLLPWDVLDYSLEKGEDHNERREARGSVEKDVEDAA